MSVINESRILKQARRLADSAKDGTMRIDGITYEIKFDRYQGHYTCAEKQGEVFVRFNTRKLSQAKQWLREHLLE